MDGRPPKRFLHVLLVEDNQVNQLVAIRSLAKTGHSVVIVTNGRDALKALKNGSYNLVLMDIHMPVMDGIEATATIREREKRLGSTNPLPARKKIRKVLLRTSSNHKNFISASVLSLGCSSSTQWPRILGDNHRGVRSHNLHLRPEQSSVRFLATDSEYRHFQRRLREFREVFCCLLKRHEIGPARAHSSRTCIRRRVGSPVRFRNRVGFVSSEAVQKCSK